MFYASKKIEHHFWAGKNWPLWITLYIIYLPQAKESKEGTQCQQALLILSDGSASYEKEIFAKYNADKSVRIFCLFTFYFCFTICEKVTITGVVYQYLVYQLILWYLYNRYVFLHLLLDLHNTQYRSWKIWLARIKVSWRMSEHSMIHFAVS